ncbi:hypothetical protein CDS [Bradyrhizobium sp.]|nr:hypothetical protein CDS [Bradyrhizobium sp.]
MDSRACLTLEAITPELDANSSRVRRFPSAHKPAKSRRPPPRAVVPMLGLQAATSQRKLLNLRL